MVVATYGVWSLILYMSVMSLGSFDIAIPRSNARTTNVPFSLHRSRAATFGWFCKVSGISVK
uniref:Uncharacterized protein n=1 Tax=Anopheles minimus TaxID=112268 RepID=A0A182WAP8_9DIPT